MKLTTSQLRQIIKEEVQKVIRENAGGVKVMIDFGEFPGDPYKLEKNPAATLALLKKKVPGLEKLIGAKIVAPEGPAGGNPEVELVFSNAQDAAKALEAMGFDNDEEEPYDMY